MLGTSFGVSIRNAAEIWQHVRPTEVMLERSRHDPHVYVVAAAECAWEPEHGLQLVFRQGDELIRVGPQDGHLTDE